MADPITDAWAALLRGDWLCLLGVMAVIVMLILLVVILKIRRVQRDQSWAYNPDKTFKLRWRRG